MVVDCCVCSSGLFIRSCGSIYYCYVCSSTYRSWSRSKIFSKDWNNRKSLSSGQTVLYVAVAVGIIFLIKNLIAAFEVFFQNFFIQRMCYEFKNKLLHSYAQVDYGFYLTRNSSFGLQVVGGDAEKAFSTGMVSLASIISECVIFIFLVGMIVYMNPTLAFIIFAIGVLLSFLISKFLLPQFYYWGQKLQQVGIFTGQNLMQFFHAFKEIVLLGKKGVLY